MPTGIAFTLTPDSTHRVVLDGAVYGFRLRWNTLSEAWHIYVGPFGEDPICKVKALVSVDLFEGYKAYDGVPKGQLLLIDVQKMFGRPGKDDIGGQNTRFSFIYLTAAEAALLNA